MASTITAVIPVYNNRDLIGQAIRSVREQTRGVNELLVVDDGSTDGSSEEAEALGACVIRLPDNRGPSAARNSALKQATGDFVAFLDADDVWLPTHCERLSEMLSRHPTAALVTSRTQPRLPFDGSSDEVPRREPFDALRYLVRDNFVTQSAAMVRRHVLLEAGGYDERRRYSEDYALWLRIALAHDFIALPEVSVTRRSHSGQVTWENQRPLYAASWELRLALLEEPRLRSDISRMDGVLAALRQALDMEFEFTWRDLGESSFNVVAAAAARVPGASKVRSRWHWRKVLGWRAWVTLVRLSRRLRGGEV